MKLLGALIILSALFVGANAHAMAPLSPTLSLEMKIAYGQGRFGALYDHCGSKDERNFIGGSLANWRTETFRGYQGNPEDRAQVELVFDQAVHTVMASNCKDWKRQAAATWSLVSRFARYGNATAAN